MFEWKVTRLAADIPAVLEKTLNELEQNGFQVVEIVAQPEHVLVIAKRKRG